MEFNMFSSLDLQSYYTRLFALPLLSPPSSPHSSIFSGYAALYLSRGWNNDPTFFFPRDVCFFLCKMKILVLSLPLHNALTIHSPLSACEATLQGN